MTNSAAITAYWDAAAPDFDDESVHEVLAGRLRGLIRPSM
jgi:hypothetical protein